MKGLSNLGIFVLWVFLGGGLYLHFYEGWSLPSDDRLFYFLLGVGVILYFMNSSISKVESTLMEKILKVESSFLEKSSNLSSSEINQEILVESEKVIDGPKDGPFEDFYPDERLKLRGFYLNGKRDGDWEFFDEWGDLLVTGIYKDGIKEGIWKEYHYEGKELYFQESYKGGEISDGRWGSFHYNGKIKSKGQYYKGKKHGLWESFDENGTLKISGSFKNGSRDGVFNQYYPDGGLRIRCVFYTPLLVDCEFFYSTPKNVIESKGRFDNGNKDGIWKKYDKNGVLINETEFKNGSYKVNKFFSKDEGVRWKYSIDKWFDFIETRTKHKDFGL
jgi:antitoxin component YwqK of YwqJK toxin-antitoxin module